MKAEPVIESIDTIVPLERMGAALRSGVDRTYERYGSIGKAARSVLDGSWMGHPLHPAIVSIPVGAWTTGAVLDAAGFDDAADLAIALGLCAAVTSILSGLTDYSEAKKAVTKLGVSHAICNGAGTALYVLSLALRRANRRKAGVALSLAGLGFIGAGGYLGGEIAYDPPKDET